MAMTSIKVEISSGCNQLLISYNTLKHLVLQAIITKLVSAMTSFLALVVCSSGFKCQMVLKFKND